MNKKGLVPLASLMALLVLVGCQENVNRPPNQVVTLTVLDPRNAGYTVAYQVGNSSWTTLNPNANNTYTINLGGQGKYGVAVLCGAGNVERSFLQVVHATSSELPNPVLSCPSWGNNQPEVLYTLNLDLTATGARTGDMVWVSAFGAESKVLSVSDPARTAVQVQGVPGIQDMVVVVRRDYSTILSAEILRNINVTDGGSSTHTLGAPLGTYGVTVNNLPTGFPHLLSGVFFLSRNNKAYGHVGVGGVSFSYRQVRGFAQGDRYYLLTSASSPDFRSTVVHLKSSAGGDISASFPNPWIPGFLSVTSSPHPTVSGLNHTGINLKAYMVNLTGDRLGLRAIVSKGWLGTGTIYGVPDLSGILNYIPFANGSEVSVSVGAIFSPGALSLGEVGFLSRGMFLFDPSAFTASADIAFAVAAGNYTVGGGSVRLP